MARNLYCNCVGWDRSLMSSLNYLINNSDDITLDEFASEIGQKSLSDIQQQFGYQRTGLKMSEDLHVRYYREPWSGIPFLVHSGIEYVFATDDEIWRLNAHAQKQEDASYYGVLVINDPWHLSSLEAEDSDKNDRFEELIDAIDQHQGAIALVLSEDFPAEASYEKTTLDRWLEIKSDYQLVLRYWVGESPSPEGFSPQTGKNVELSILADAGASEVQHFTQTSDAELVGGMTPL